MRPLESATSRRDRENAGRRRRPCLFAVKTAPNRRPRDRLSVGRMRRTLVVFVGMSAITHLLMTFVQPGDIVVHSGPALCRDRKPDRTNFRPGRDPLARFSAGATATRSRPCLNRPKAWAESPLIISKSPANRPTLGSMSGRGRRSRRLFGDEKRRSRSTHVPRPLWHHPLRHGAIVSLFVDQNAGGTAICVAESRRARSDNIR